LTLGADPTLQNNLGRSSLHLAAEAGTLGLFMMIQNLLHFDLNIEDKKGLTVLHLAIIQRHEEMALLIISLLPKLDFQEKSSSLALSIAVETGNYRIARHLMVNRSSKQINLEEIKKKCLDKDIKKLLVRYN
jgi:ankyrin repeat protein